MKVETGVMIVKNGKAWGCTYSDGHSTSYGWMNLEDAPIHDPQFCRKPTDVTYANSPDRAEIATGKIVSVKRKTTVELEPCPM